MLRMLTSGESHGPSLAVILEGLPSGLEVPTDFIDRELRRRQQGYGRGGRMAIESDHVKVVSGLRHGFTLGSPVCCLIENRDHANWVETMNPSPTSAPVDRQVFLPRPGHADLSGALKYRHKDMRNVLERASARETAARVVGGALCKLLLASLGISIYSHVVSIGTVRSDASSVDIVSRYEEVENSPVRSADPEAARAMINEIDACRAHGDTVGGVFEVVVTGVPVGIGSHVQYDRRLDARLCSGLMSIPGIKGVEVGLGFGAASERGSRVQDEIVPDPDRPLGFARLTNNAGGIEGGMSNGELVVIRAAMKPIPTLMTPLRSIDIRDMSAAKAVTERSDVCAVPAASVVGEAMVAYELACSVVEKLGGDSIEEMADNLARYQERCREWLIGM